MLAVNDAAPLSNYNVSITSGKDKFRTSTVMSYFNQDGILKNTGFERYSLRSNNEYQVNDAIRIGLNLAPSLSISKNDYYDGSYGFIYHLLTLDPTISPYNEDGTYKTHIQVPGGFRQPNVVRSLQVRNNLRRTGQLLSNAYADITLLKDFLFRTSFNVSLDNSNQREFVPANSGFAFWDGDLANGSYSTRFGYNWMSENTVNYTKNFNKHSIEALAGYAAQKYREENANLSGTDFPDDAVQWINAAATRNGSNSMTSWTLLSYIGRLNYNFNGKYLFSAAVRRDGSSRFGANRKWGLFPSVSAGWIVSDEAFFNSLPIDYFKIRGSYGLTGNNNIGDFRQYGNIGSASYVFGNAIAQGRALSNLGNPNLTWETTRQLNVGFDAGILKNRVALSFDYYKKNTNDLLYQVDIPRGSGYSNIQSNIGAFDFWGYEAGINSKNITGAFSWNTDFNISFNRSKVKQLGTNNVPLGGYNVNSDFSRTAVGQPSGCFGGTNF
jgi:TonB-linked SusC/RagA family outer membrane protein